MSVTLQDVENTESAAEEFDSVVSRRRQRQQARLDGEFTREHVETADDPDGIHIEVDGELIEMEPVGLGTRARISKQAMKAEERGDDAEALDAVIKMIDVLIDHSPDDYDQQFWDGLQDDAIRSAFSSLGQQSAGGNGR